DANGNTTTVAHPLSVAGEAPAAPVIRFTQPGDPSGADEVTLFADTFPHAPYEIRGGAVEVLTGTADDRGAITRLVPLRPNTVNTLAVTVRAANGLASEAATLDLRHDGVRPYVVALTPVSGTTEVDPETTVRIH